eukprot:TRINITY_DN7104_c0_g2_i2.p1 TRINITY_DN7104_c0_g2~~TRINITY_DN7104_c0_g2_i2.p1  ORF type:complete len:184 (-),score=18.10 TRINITY_DN7104_c0_g2_i2:701-1192(-)
MCIRDSVNADKPIDQNDHLQSPQPREGTEPLSTSQVRFGGLIREFPKLSGRERSEERKQPTPSPEPMLLPTLTLTDLFPEKALAIKKINMTATVLIQQCDLYLLSCLLAKLHIIQEAYLEGHLTPLVGPLFKLGLIGAGNIGKSVLNSLLKLPKGISTRTSDS